MSGDIIITKVEQILAQASQQEAKPRLVLVGAENEIVMNDIGMGNILYKALLLWVRPTIANVVLGAKVPLVVPSRADSVETKLNSIALAVVMLRYRQGLGR